jgi:predicted Zn finger-like uncharacterized protein
MIVSCPACAARFRIDRERLAGKRLTLRCGRCRTPFKAELPSRGRADAPGIRVMVAHTDHELCGTICGILEHAGMRCQVGHDGRSVLRQMEQAPPQVAVVDVALQGLYAFEVVDKVRRRPGLGEVKIILLSSVYNRMAYKRLPASLYGADDYIEKHHIPDDLVPKINRLVIGAVPAQAPGASEEERTGASLSSQEAAEQTRDYIHLVNTRIRSAEDRQVQGDQEIGDDERARRLARIIVSDIALYNQDKVDEGIRNGNWSELLAAEIQEARKLFLARFPDERLQRAKILEAAFIDLLERRRRELNQ